MTQEYLWFLIQETLAFNLMEPRCPRPERVQVVSATGEPIPVMGWYKNSSLPFTSGSMHFDCSCYRRNRHSSSTWAGSALHKNTSTSHNSPGTGERRCRRHAKAHCGNYVKEKGQDLQLGNKWRSISGCHRWLFDKADTHYDMTQSWTQPFLPFLDNTKSRYKHHQTIPPLPGTYSNSTNTRNRYTMLQMVRKKSVAIEWLLLCLSARNLSPLDGSCCVCPQEIWRHSAAHWLSWTEQEDSEDFVPSILPRWSAWSNSGCTVLSTKYLQNGWVLATLSHPAVRAKTAFSLIQARESPSFAACLLLLGTYHLMNKFCHELPFVTVYCDDIRIHSTTVTQHEEHLCFVFHHTCEEALHWVVPVCLPWMHLSPRHGTWSSDLCSTGCAHSRNVSDLCSFHRLALHYRRYILRFAEIAVLLHHLTGKEAATMNWPGHKFCPSRILHIFKWTQVPWESMQFESRMTVSLPMQAGHFPRQNATIV